MTLLSGLLFSIVASLCAVVLASDLQVSGAGQNDVNGLYRWRGTQAAPVWYKDDDYLIGYCCGGWYIASAKTQASSYFKSDYTGNLGVYSPGWFGIGGAFPVPTVAAASAPAPPPPVNPPRRRRGPAPSPPAPKIGDAAFGTIQSLFSGKCLDLPGGNTNNGNQLWLWDCNGHDTQKWQFFDNQLIYLGLTTKCVDIPGGDTKNGNQLQIWDCNGKASQNWGYDSAMKTVYLASSNGDATKCMDLRDGGTSNGTPVQVYDCTGNGNKNQMWETLSWQGGQTSTTQQLNKAIEPGSNGVYSGGKGLIVRNPFDGYESYGQKYRVVPSTFWTNDLVVPTAIFPTGWGGFQHGNGDPNCPNTEWNGFYKMKKCPTDPRTGESGPWNYATTGYVIADKMSEVFPHWDDIQSNHWGYGVFYPTDSNAADQRCRWLSSHNGYDCPDGWIPWGGTFQKDGQGTGTHRGAGAYPMGNPYADASWGGGAGCHFDNYNIVDQTNAVGNNLNLIRNKDCECDYTFRDNWGHWVEHWIEFGKNQKSLDGWFNGGKKKAPGHGLDQAACWVNNPRDMINLQNQIYWKRYDWSNQLAPKSSWNDSDPASLRMYWGWNEVPINVEMARNEALRQAYVIKLPAALCPGSSGGLDTVACLSYGAQQNLEGDLDIYVNNKMLYPGASHIEGRPGSYIVFAREYISSGVNWQRWFYCENWVSPSRKWQIRYYPQSKSNIYGACFLDYGPSHKRFQEAKVLV